MIHLIEKPKPAGPRVTLTVEPNSERTREFLRWLIEAARRAENEQQDTEAA